MEVEQMGNVALVRVDQRLIHGQVVTNWIKRTNANKIVILDNEISADPFMKKVFMMAGPPGVKLDIYNVEEGAAEFQKNQFGDGTIMVIFRNIPAAFKSFTAGYKFPNLQVGSAGGAPGRQNVHGPITLNDEEAGMLNEIAKEGTKINFHATPDTGEGFWEDIKKKFYPSL